MIPTQLTRLADPITSQEAAQAVDVCRSQVIVLTAARCMGDFTDQDLERRIFLDLFAVRISPSRIRTARHELVARGLVEFVGYTSPPKGQRRRCIWRVTEAGA